MKVIKYLFLSISVCLLFVSMSFAQQTETTKKIYQNVEVEKFTIRQGVEFPTEKIDTLAISVVNALRGSKKFTQVAITGEQATTDAEAPTLKISGEIVKFDKGNRALRYMVGMGTGKSKLVVDIKFTDAKTGETVFQQLVDGDTTHGFLGGDSAIVRTEVADEIVKVMKKNFTEDTKKTSK
ncbi:MAG: DUF4410 domain-containing protein [Pyrinomonadaceae bacterium]